MGRILLGAFLAMVVLVMGALGLVCGSALGIVGALSSSQDTSGPAPSQEALDEIPQQYLRLCMEGSRSFSPRIPWHVICAVQRVETNFGRLDAPGVKSDVNSAGCCAGPGQFSLIVAGGGLGPGRLRAEETNSSTWGRFGVDGNGDGIKDVYDPEDSVPATARLLQYESRQGAKNDECPGVTIGGYGPAVKRALWGYNNVCWYVQGVLEFAEKYRSQTPIGGLLPGQLQLPGGLGQPNNLGYVMLPMDGRGLYQRYLTCSDQSYGKPELIAVLYTIAVQWKQLHPDGYLWIGDLNAEGHASHRWGVAVDLYATTNGSDFVANYERGNYNRQATVQLGMLFLQTGLIRQIFYNDAGVRSALIRYAQDRKMAVPNISYWPGHANHFHVDIAVERGPESTPFC